MFERERHTNVLWAQAELQAQLSPRLWDTGPVDVTAVLRSFCFNLSKGQRARLGMSSSVLLLAVFLHTVNDTTGTSFSGLFINGGTGPHSLWAYLRFSISCGKEQLADPSRRKHLSPTLGTLRPPGRLLPGHLLSSSEAVFFKAGGRSSLPCTHLATMGVCSCLQERETRAVPRCLQGN